MTLRRYTQTVDGTIPVQALLYSDEELFATQDNVGIYDGSQKSLDHQNGAVHITSHRLFYIDGRRPARKSFEMALSYIQQTEHYAGLFKSSPKVTCHLSGDPNASGSADGGAHAQYDSWECQVCAYRNPPGLSPTAARICALCGVPRTAVPPPINSVSSHHFSSSLPSSALSSSTSLAPELPLSAGRKKPIACPACTFLNHPYLRSCEICSTDLMNVSMGEFRSAPSSRPITPDPDGDDDDFAKMMKISFRKGGDKLCYAVLKRSLKTKAWESGQAGSSSLSTVRSTDPDNSAAIGRSGISGILRTVENTAKGRETHMRDALQDLEALMVKAKDMVRLAAELNEKLTAAATVSTASASDTGYGKDLAVAEPEEATFIRSSLSQLGLQISDTPVTLDMMKDERGWFNELARELARVLQGTPRDDIITSGMMKTHGIIALDEVWGGWNRARGVALIPPSTFLQVLPYLRAHTQPVISQREFPSGLNVLHTPPYTPAAFAARLSSFLAISGPKTTLEISREEQLTVALVAEMIDATEDDAGVCRDDSSAAIVGGGSGTGVEVRWWSNLFVGYIWDGQND